MKQSLQTREKIIIALLTNRNRNKERKRGESKAPKREKERIKERMC